jgi:hypothetical protein
MELNASQVSVVISVLQFQLDCLRQQQANLDEAAEDEIAEFTDDILIRECLLGELENGYQQEFSQVTRKQA